MEKQKQRWMKYGFGVIIFCAVFVVATAIKASVAENGTGWLWGGSEEIDDKTINGNETGVGLISMNNLTGGGTVPYGVNIPSTDGYLSGYAWSENMGWIAFDNSNGYLNGCPAGNGTCSARRVGNNLEGWARFASIADALAVGNSSGWQGWIKLNGSGYGIDITRMDGTGNNKMYAWSDELGWIDFSRVILPPPPTVTLSANPFTINIDTNPLPQNIALSWNVSGATTCNKSGGNWSGSMINPTTGTDNVQQASTMVTYNLSCSGPGGNTEKTITVTTGCDKKECSAAVCATVFMATGSSNNSACIAASNCSVDADCQQRGISDWKEVAP